MSSCGVCATFLDKKRVHYGGISCYACRAFFRRMTNCGQKLTCEWEGSCGTDFEEERMCKACRYGRCLAAGMTPGLVLTPESKQKRFQKYCFSDQTEAETPDTS